MTYPRHEWLDGQWVEARDVDRAVDGPKAPAHAWEGAIWVWSAGGRVGAAPSKEEAMRQAEEAWAND